MIDLHTHSTASDGSESPEHLVDLVAEAGCRAFALTDHDGLSGLAPAARRAAELGVTMVHGCEVSCAFEPGSLHVLCYFVTEAGPLSRRLVELASERAHRNGELLAKLASLGIPVSEEEVVAEARGGLIGRPHFAAVLVRHGVVPSIAEAFTRLLAKGAPAYVERTRVEFADIADVANRSGAVAVVAHPLSLGLAPDELAPALRRFAAAGFVGLECYYGSYSPEERSMLIGLARENGLVPTGGSDFHGSYKPGLALGIGRGDLVVPDEVLDELDSCRPG